MSPVVNVAAASAPPRNSSNIASSKAKSQSARSYLHKQYLKVGLNRLQKHRPKGGLKSTLIYPRAWRKISAKSGFRFTEFSEVQRSSCLASHTGGRGLFFNKGDEPCRTR